VRGGGVLRDGARLQARRLRPRHAAAREGLAGGAAPLRDGALAIAAVAVGYLAWWANRFTWDSFVFDETAQGMLPIKMWIPQSTFAIGAILLFVAVVDELVVVVRGGRPSYVVAVEERHAHGDFSSEV
jgi:TRAP-type C4-dicarboxylate transport system permease small subunit